MPLVRSARVALLVLFLVLGMSSVARAATFTPDCSASSLSAALAASQANAEDDTITLAAGCTYSLTGALPSITAPNVVTIHGNGATITDDPAASGFTAITIQAGDLVVDHLTGTGLNGINGSAFWVQGGQLDVSDSTFHNNDGVVGGVFAGQAGVATFTRCDLSKNTGVVGGAIYGSGGVIAVVNSTLADETGVVGGAIGMQGGSLIVSGSTIVRGSSVLGGNVALQGGTATFADSVIGGGSALLGSDVYVSGATATDGGHNVVGSNPGFFSAATSITGLDVGVGPLADNGGSTMTCALLDGSPALGTGDGGLAQSTLGGVDQRGYSRKLVASDVGAFERSALLYASPAATTVQTAGTAGFTGFGGSGAYSFSLLANRSGGTITPAGQYVAGPMIGDDVVQVTDGHEIAYANVHVIASPPVVIDLEPAATHVAPRGAATFVATGGTSPYAFDLVVNLSGGTVDAGGNYRAGARGLVSDVVRVTDAQGNTQTATIAVGAPVSITPSAPTVSRRGTLAFTASGGAPSYHWSFVTNLSGGTLDANTGAYTAGTTPAVTDVIRAVDSLGSVATTEVRIGSGLSVAPPLSTVAPGGSVQFTASGGAGRFTWTIAQNGSGGTIDPGTGAYVAGATGSTTDIIVARDASGATQAAVVDVTASTPTSTPDAGATVDAGTAETPDAGAAPASTTTPEPDAGSPTVSSSDSGMSDTNSGGCSTTSRSDGPSGALLLVAVVFARRRKRRGNATKTKRT